MKRMQIGLIGCGTVGEGVARILLDQQEILKDRLGMEMVLKKVADTDTQRTRSVTFAEGVFTTDASEILEDPEIDVVVEMVGGTGFAKDAILKAMEQGKHVVTANKKLLALEGNSLFAKAFQKNVTIAYEASVGGCMPIIKTLRENLVANRIFAMTGILNGTCNYILTEITRLGLSFEEALEQAKIKGFAEADPTLDIEGCDAAHKLAIISAIAYGMEIDFEGVYVEGISRIEPLDILYADQFGYRIKLLAISKNHGDSIEARVHPAMIPVDCLLSQVGGSVNALSIFGDCTGEMMLYGHGAGMMPTASAVVADLADIARDMKREDGGRLPALGYPSKNIRKIPVLPISEIQTHYYFRISAADQPGVLSRVSGILAKYSISIMSVHQKERHASDAVPLVFMTHRAKEADVRKALGEIRELPEIGCDPVLIRIEDPQANGCAHT
ncbi:homoserine dehydrogenase [Desulfobotulus alkaliphilus]|uniref:Homoserine dehydrogenase n=1 Tax=Desulfobotulus alkaliphilus TaxID=622671 RepID=A0A562RIP3_9BACT|nr:homoserine dehydrogenase [Desulfobotulus alkaliphilus]TWI68901.1 homoserine dehydrogenase [Desulfobotulus alkaliphilus]